MTESSVIDRSAFASPVLEDMDADGDLDIIQAAFDGGVYVFDIDGKMLDGWPVFPHYTGSFVPEPDIGRVFTTPAVADFNGDGYPELLVGSNEKLGQGGMTGAVYLIDGRGTNAPGGPYLPHWPVTITSFNLFPLVADGVPNSGVIGAFDGTLAAAMREGGSREVVVAAGADFLAELAGGLDP